VVSGANRKGGAKGTKAPKEAESIVTSVLAVLGDIPNGSAAEEEHFPRPRPGLFRTRAEEAWIRLWIVDHMETHAVRSEWFRRYLSIMRLRQTGTIPRKSSIAEALDMIEAQALLGGHEEETFFRVTGDTKAILIDLGDARWRSVVVTSAGYKVLDYHPCAFRRYAKTRALPAPSDGSLADLRALHPRLLSDDEWALVAAWLVGALRPWGSYAILELVGEAGSGKTTLAKMLLSLTDPSETQLAAPPATPRDLAVATQRVHVLGYDNLSRVAEWLSDSLCRLATGIAFSERRLYTNADEHYVKARMPIVLTAIPNVVVAEDLRDRTLIVSMEQLADDARVSDSALEEKWLASLLPSLFGGLLKALSIGLQRLPDVTLPQRVRMLDHLRWAVACAPGLGLSAEAMLDAHLVDRERGAVDAVNDSPISAAIVSLATEQPWNGTARDLLVEINRRTVEDVRKEPGWPASPSLLSRMLHRLASDLRRTGIAVGFQRRGRKGTRIIRLSMIGAPEREAA
jgi:energy-coupling factor transporter ATP-binding protein EcfA2